MHNKHNTNTVCAFVIMMCLLSPTCPPNVNARSDGIRYCFHTDGNYKSPIICSLFFDFFLIPGMCHTITWKRYQRMHLMGWKCWRVCKSLKVYSLILASSLFVIISINRYPRKNLKSKFFAYSDFPFNSELCTITCISNTQLTSMCWKLDPKINQLTGSSVQFNKQVLATLLQYLLSLCHHNQCIKISERPSTQICS